MRVIVTGSTEVATVSCECSTCEELDFFTMCLFKYNPTATLSYQFLPDLKPKSFWSKIWSLFRG